MIFISQWKAIYATSSVKYRAFVSFDLTPFLYDITAHSQPSKNASTLEARIVIVHISLLQTWNFSHVCKNTLHATEHAESLTRNVISKKRYRTCVKSVSNCLRPF